MTTPHLSSPRDGVALFNVIASTSIAVGMSSIGQYFACVAYLLLAAAMIYTYEGDLLVGRALLIANEANGDCQKALDRNHRLMVLLDEERKRNGGNKDGDDEGAGTSAPTQHGPFVS